MKIFETYMIPIMEETQMVVIPGKTPVKIGNKVYGYADINLKKAKGLHSELYVTGLKDIIKKNVDPVLIEQGRLNIEVIVKQEPKAIIIECVQLSDLKPKKK